MLSLRVGLRIIMLLMNIMGNISQGHGEVVCRIFEGMIGWIFDNAMLFLDEDEKE